MSLSDIPYSIVKICHKLRITLRVCLTDLGKELDVTMVDILIEVSIELSLEACSRCKVVKGGVNLEVMHQ
jgi:hypothetical protein